MSFMNQKIDSQPIGEEGEKFVNELACNTFFKHYCYPGVKYENKDKKEICDLLVIFDDLVIIFSVKNYEFKGKHFRYFNNTLEKARKQISGAYKTLFKTEVLEIKHPDKENEIFPKENIKRVYRVIVNLGEGVKFYPFNQLTVDKSFVHVFDKDTFQNLMIELDTIKDFTEYLDKRENIFVNTQTILLPGEENDFPVEAQEEFFKTLTEEDFTIKKNIISGTEKDLLAHYLELGNKFFSVFENNETSYNYLIIDNKWKEYEVSSKFKIKTEENEYSYFVDKFVENELFSGEKKKDREEIATRLLSFNRLERRGIGLSFFDFIEKNNLSIPRTFNKRYMILKDTCILFVGHSLDVDIDMFQNLSEIALYSFLIKEEYKYERIILIGIDSNFSFKFSIVDNKKLPKQYEESILKYAELLGWKRNDNYENFSIKNYKKGMDIY